MEKTIWQSQCQLKTLVARQEILKKIRLFFEQKKYLEVETPILSHDATVDVNIDSFITHFSFNEKDLNALYLQTSPEFHMKRLLAQFCVPIYQLSKSFRNGEKGATHNPEFTILEWYKPNFNHFELMKEIEEFIDFVLGSGSYTYMTYKQSFQEILNLKLDEINLDLLKEIIIKSSAIKIDSIDEGLDYLFTHFIEKELKKMGRVFIYDYPKSQAALAKMNNDGTAARFELYINGLELANGFNELNNSLEQEERFTKDIAERLIKGKKVLPYSKRLVMALPELPDCAGVALGVDRLCMIALNKTSIADVITFTIDLA